MFKAISAKDLVTDKEIGKGGYGAVYSGKWNHTSVAIKKLLLTYPSEAALDEFKKEAEIMASCSHPNVIQFYGVCLEPNHYAIVMDYLPKGSLHHVLHNASEALPWSPIRWQIAQEMALGLHYLHSQKIVHRDFKSLNVLLDKNYHPKITDFGLSKIKLETSSSSTKGVTGSIRWQAPELFKRKAVATFASDIYSFGMVLWEITSRKIPFEDAPNEITAMSWIQQGELETVPDNTPKDYADVIQQCWQAADKRPSTKEIILTFDKIVPKQLETKEEKEEVKAWHYDRNYAEKKEGFLAKASHKDIEKVVSFYQHHPVPGMEIKDVQVIVNPDLNRRFGLQMKLLQERKGNKVFDPKWPSEKNADQRKQVHQLAEDLAKPYRDSDYPEVKLLPLWHGTTSAAIEGICKSGYASLATTDSGYFGKGYYSAHEAKYADRVYSQGALVLNWVCYYSAYPVVDGDMNKLAEKANYQNYDAHFVPVAPASNSRDEVSYYPCKPNQNHTYIEVVVFESAQCLPRYLVELQPTLSKVLASKSEVVLPVAKLVENKPVEVPGKLNYQKGYELWLKCQYQEAVLYLLKAAQQDYPPAYLRLAIGGATGPENKPESEFWYQKAASKIEWFKEQAQTQKPEAQCDLGWCYKKGIGVAQDNQQAVFWYQKAANQGLALAQCNLGACYDNGEGIKQDYQQAVFWYQKAADQGYALAQFKLGVCYDDGQGVKQDYQQAIFWYQKAADQSHARAQCKLGWCYGNGQGVKQDYQQAIFWYQKAADQGHANAQCDLGWCYQNGQGVKQDYQQAVFWYQKAADQNSAYAQCILGWCYQNGQGVKQDYQQAVFCYQNAASQDNKTAKNNLEELLKAQPQLKNLMGNSANFFQSSSGGNNNTIILPTSLIKSTKET